MEHKRYICTCQSCMVYRTSMATPLDDLIAQAHHEVTDALTEDSIGYNLSPEQRARIISGLKPVLAAVFTTLLYTVVVTDEP